MSLGYQLHQEQTQRLVMTTQMKQAIELLQCSSLELSQYIADWVDGNPCADYEPIVRPLQDAWEMRVPPARTPRPLVTGSAQGSLALEQIVPCEITLLDGVEAQLRLIRAGQGVIHTAHYLLGCLDENGYLRESMADVCVRLGVAEATFDEALHVLQSCDPPGIGARDLAECLRLQLDFVDLAVRPLVGRLIDHHLKEVADGKLPVIAKRLKVPVSAVQSAVDALRRLNPRPGFACGSARTEYVIPDVIVRCVGSDYVVLSNENAQPMLTINYNYQRLLRLRPDAETRDYLQEKFQSAEWLVRCLEQRRLTLYRVAEAIVAHQSDFFQRGPIAMKPLTLRRIADKVNLHESTVSRATRGKYMLTPRGLFEMKYFFTAELQADVGVTSAQVAKQEIQVSIDAEDSGHPLSDEALTQALSNRGIHISRRTVAKYREELKIPPSWRRRRFED